MRSRTRAALVAAILAGWLNPAGGQTPPPPPPVPTATPQAAPCPACAKPSQEVYRLRHAAAADVAHALKSHFGENCGVSVVAEPVSNTLLVSAGPAEFQRIMKIVAAIDQAPPSVQLTMTWIEARGGFIEKTGLCPAGESGCGKAWTMSDREVRMFNALLRQGKQDGTLEILSRPQLQVMDNQTGFVQVGQQYPCPSQAPDGKTGIEMVPVGLTTKVTPRFLPDGKVLLRIETIHTRQTPQPVELGNGLAAPAFNVESAQTTVCLSDGATAVMLAGEQCRECRVECHTPVLSEIPYVSRLFTNVAVSKERTEMLLVVTAHVVRTAPEVAPPAVAPVTTARPPVMPVRAVPAPMAAPVAVPPASVPAPPVPLRGTVMLPCPAPAPAVATPVALPRPVSAPVAVVAPSPRPAPACCEAACGACDKVKAYELVKAYHKACAAGDKDAATRCAVQALAIDPTCFTAAPPK